MKHQHKIEEIVTKELGMRMEGKKLKAFKKMLSQSGDGVESDVVSMRHHDYTVYGLNTMCALIAKLKGEDLNVLEIGSYRGESSVIFHGWFKNVDCVDPYGKVNEISEIDNTVETNP